VTVEPVIVDLRTLSPSEAYELCWLVQQRAEKTSGTTRFSPVRRMQPLTVEDYEACDDFFAAAIGDDDEAYQLARARWFQALELEAVQPGSVTDRYGMQVERAA
jgi:hypothetical protein